MTFRDNDIGVLGFFRHRNVQSSVKLSFFCQTNNFSIRATKICQNQPKGMPHIQEKFCGAATYMKVTMKVFTGLSLCSAHCTIRDSEGDIQDQ